MNELTSNNLVEQIKSLLEASRQKIAVEVNTTLLHTYWQIGKIIVEDEALHIGDVEYEKQPLRQLSKALTTEFGKGFSRSNLSNMRQFYLTHKDVQTASGQLSWSHYCELQAISDEQKRSFYEKECINSRWSVREHRRQIDSSLFERINANMLLNICLNLLKSAGHRRQGFTMYLSKDCNEPFILRYSRGNIMATKNQIAPAV